MMSASNVLRDFFSVHWASFSINLMCLLNWPFDNSKSFKPNRLVSSFRKRKRTFLIGLLVTLSSSLFCHCNGQTLCLLELLLSPSFHLQKWGYWSCSHWGKWHSHTNPHCITCFYSLFCYRNGRNLCLQYSLSKFFFWPSVLTMSLPNKPQKFWLIIMALALPLLFSLAFQLFFPLKSHSNNS